MRSNLQFIYTEPQTELERLIGGYYHINAFGLIEPGDDEKFRKLLENGSPPSVTTIYIDSAGGDVEAALSIGRQIREQWFSTDVGKCHLDNEGQNPHLVKRNYLPAICYSAATLVYLGGKLRYFTDGSKFGVHQFSYRNPAPDDVPRSQVLSAKIAQFLIEMGIELSFLERSAKVAATEIQLIPPEELRSTGIVTGGVTAVSWSANIKQNIIYVKGERNSLYGHHKSILAWSRNEGFFFWAVIEAQGRESELTNFSLVEIVVNDETLRIDVSSRCHRIVIGAAVHVLAKVSVEEAKLLAYSASFGVQIRATSEAGTFLGISAMSTNGGEDMLQTLFESLRTDAISTDKVSS